MDYLVTPERGVIEWWVSSEGDSEVCKGWALGIVGFPADSLAYDSQSIDLGQAYASILVNHGRCSGSKHKIW